MSPVSPLARTSLQGTRHAEDMGIRDHVGNRGDGVAGTLVRARDIARQVADAEFGIHYRIG